MQPVMEVQVAALGDEDDNDDPIHAAIMEAQAGVSGYTGDPAETALV
jgi:hypothetical protein